jgi:hypothetical protein
MYGQPPVSSKIFEECLKTSRRAPVMRLCHISFHTGGACKHAQNSLYPIVASSSSAAAVNMACDVQRGADILRA